MTERLPHEKGFHISWDQIHRDSRALAWRLDKRGPGEDGAWLITGVVIAAVGAIEIVRAAHRRFVRRTLPTPTARTGAATHRVGVGADDEGRARRK